MTSYIPSDDTAQFLAREYISVKTRAEFQRGRIAVTIGDMADDGSCPVHLRAETEQFSLSDYFDVPQIDGRAWIDMGASHSVLFDFPGEMEPYAFILANQATA